MELIDARRSIRKFKQDPIPEAYIQELLEVARLAPSTRNLQSSRYIVIKGEEAKLTECMIPFLTKAPVA